MKKIIIFLFIIFTTVELKSQVVQFADYYPLSVGNFFVYIDEEYSPPSTSVFKLSVTKDTNANNHKYFKVMRSANHIAEFLIGWFRYDSTNGNLLVYSPGNGCLPYANDKIIDSLASKKSNHCDGCIYNAMNLRTCTDTINGTYFGQTVKTKSYHHDGLTFEDLVYAKGFGKVSYTGGEPVITYIIFMKGCKINGVVYGDTILSNVSQISGILPIEFKLSQNYPNPFNPATNIKFSIPKNSNVILKVFDMLGKEISTLVNEKLNAGEYERSFDGSNLPSGVYFYKLTSGEFTETKKMLMIK